jgi:ribonuclease I
VNQRQYFPTTEEFFNKIGAKRSWQLLTDSVEKLRREYFRSSFAQE